MSPPEVLVIAFWLIIGGWGVLAWLNRFWDFHLKHAPLLIVGSCFGPLVWVAGFIYKKATRQRLSR